MPGVWRHVGIGGVVTGLDMAEAMTRIEDDGEIDLAAVRVYLTEIEIGRLAAEAERRAAADPAGSA